MHLLQVNVVEAMQSISCVAVRALVAGDQPMFALGRLARVLHCRGGQLLLLESQNACLPAWARALANEAPGTAAALPRHHPSFLRCADNLSCYHYWIRNDELPQKSHSNYIVLQLTRSLLSNGLQSPG